MRAGCIGTGFGSASARRASSRRTGPPWSAPAAHGPRAQADGRQSSPSGANRGSRSSATDRPIPQT